MLGPPRIIRGRRTPVRADLFEAGHNGLPVHVLLLEVALHEEDPGRGIWLLGADVGNGAAGHRYEGVRLVDVQLRVRVELGDCAAQELGVPLCHQLGGVLVCVDEEARGVLAVGGLDLELPPARGAPEGGASFASTTGSDIWGLRTRG